MREIKFRAWVKFPNKTNMNPVMQYNAQDWASFGKLCKDDSEVELMQFTGMTNRNGDEVYEGDIIQTEHGYGVIEYNSTMGKWECAFDFDIDDLYVYVDDGEVIGNIYENRDLLDGDD